MPVTIAIIITASVLLLLFMQPSRVMYIKRLILPALCFVFILCLVFLSESAVKAAARGLDLWAGVVIPSLFPFFVAAEIIKSTGFIRAAGVLLEPVMKPFFNVPGCGSFPLLMGITSGYPVGAKITCDFRENGDLTKSEAEKLLAYTNNSGPLFIIGAVGSGMLGSNKAGIYLYICHVLACLTVGFIFRFYKAERRENDGKRNLNTFKTFKLRLFENYRNTGNHFGIILSDAIKNSVSTILIIGGFIVLFSVIIAFLKESNLFSSLSMILSRILSVFKIDRSTIEGVLCGLFEITTGSEIISDSPGISAIIKLPAISFIIGWAGLSVHFQVIGITSRTDLSIRPYIAGKLLQGIISAFYTWLGIKCLDLKLVSDQPVLGHNTPLLRNWLFTSGTSLWLVVVVLTFFILLSLFRAFFTISGKNST